MAEAGAVNSVTVSVAVAVAAWSCSPSPTLLIPSVSFNLDSGTVGENWKLNPRKDVLLIFLVGLCLWALKLYEI